jgi:hypothetical protein
MALAAIPQQPAHIAEVEAESSVEPAEATAAVAPVADPDVESCAETTDEADALAALAQASEETGLADRESWLARFTAGQTALGVDEVEAIRRFGASVRELRAAGRVVIAGEFAWEVA